MQMHHCVSSYLRNLGFQLQAPLCTGSWEMLRQGWDGYIGVFASPETDKLSYPLVSQWMRLTSRLRCVLFQRDEHTMSCRKYNTGGNTMSPEDNEAAASAPALQCNRNPGCFLLLHGVVDSVESHAQAQRGTACGVSAFLCGHRQHCTLLPTPAAAARRRDRSQGVQDAASGTAATESSRMCAMHKTVARSLSTYNALENCAARRSQKA